VPSQNGAAVLILHGGGGSRDGGRRHAELLARAGFGVLLYDARGRGRSDGNTDAYGWTWGRDVDAAIAWLQRRPDVQRNRIGALGLSTGADVLVEVAARRHDLRAVVADGSTNRSLEDVIRITKGGDWLSIPFFWTQYTAAEVFEGARPGPPLAQLARRVSPTPILFIASTWAIERKVAPIYARAAGEQGDLWEVDAGHTQGLREHPREYARHVIGFFNRALRGTPS
jgi:pimeloyl-ACP methyl ester carboxylesterase